MLVVGVYIFTSVYQSFSSNLTLSNCTNLSTKYKFILFFCAMAKMPLATWAGFASSLTKLWLGRWLVGLWQCACHCVGSRNKCWLSKYQAPVGKILFRKHEYHVCAATILPIAPATQIFLAFIVHGKSFAYILIKIEFLFEILPYTPPKK